MLNKKGFTLAELVAVILLLALLATFSFPLIGSLTQKYNEDKYIEQAKDVLVTLQTKRKDLGWMSENSPIPATLLKEYAEAAGVSGTIIEIVTNKTPTAKASVILSIEYEVDGKTVIYDGANDTFTVER